MNRDQKAVFVDELNQRFTNSPFVILTDFKGSTVAQMDAVRRSCEKAGVHFRVVKNTLAVRALEGTGMEKLADHFTGNIGVLISGEDAVAAAKLFKQQVKDNDKLQVKAGFFDGDVLDPKGVSAVAELPSREELLGTLLATLLEGPRNVLGVLQAPPRDLLYLLSNYANKLETQG